jgi:serine/threonine protein phosphatase PrpC
MTRFNAGVGEDIGFQGLMEDGLIVEEDIGGSEWKLISLFAVMDGHGGNECMKYIKDNLVLKIREWTKLLDEAGDLTEMVKVLMNKTFFELDYEFNKKFPELSQTCGCTMLCSLIIESRVFTFHVGDCKSYLFRNDVLYKMNIDHLPVNILLPRAEVMKEIELKRLEDSYNMIGYKENVLYRELSGNFNIKY